MAKKTPDPQPQPTSPLGDGDPTVVKLLRETRQSSQMRVPLLKRLQALWGDRLVLVFFTSFSQPVIIDDQDADIIEGVLQKSDLRRGLSLVINSPGGSGLAAERIINVCRAYSKGDFEVIVPKMAKSAATMICLGANKIWMSETSELGPIDPQVRRGNRITSAHDIVTSYRELLQQAVTTTGKVEPYLLQLARYDASEIQGLMGAQQLSEDIAVRALSTGMLKGNTPDTIRAKIKPFTDPTVLSSHGRRVGHDSATTCELNVELLPLHDERWEVLWEVYVRASWYVEQRCSKLVETSQHHFEAPKVKSQDQPEN